MSFNKDFENLCFEGGGVRGFSYYSVIQELEKLGKLSKFKRFAGTSVGSFFAMLLAADYNMEDIKLTKTMLDFVDIPSNSFVCNIYNIWRYYGLFDSKFIMDYLESVISIRYDINITMKELYNITGKELVIVSCCLNREKGVYFHHAVYPHMRVVDAIMASISSPFALKPKKMECFGTTDYFIDGGVIDNYPIWVFNDIQMLYNNTLYLVDKSVINPKTLGIKLLHADEENDKIVYKGWNPINTIFKFGIQVLNTLMMQIERSTISESYIRQTLAIDTHDIYFLDFDLSDDNKLLLSKNGSDAVQKFFKSYY